MRPVRIALVTLLVAEFAARAQPTPAAAPASEPPIRLRGTIRERGTRTPLAGAQVFARAPSGEELAATDSDSSGGFALRLPAPGRIAIVVARTGYETLTVDETLPPATTLEVTYRLMPRSTSRYASTVRGARGAREEISRITISDEEVTHIPGTHGDALRAITNLPGVARAPFDAGQLVIRGAAPADTIVLVAGHGIPQLFHFGGLTSVYNSDLLASIDFLPGNFGVRYGRATGGVIDIAPRAGARDGWHGYAKLDFIDAGFKVEGPVGKGSIAIAARRSLVDAFFSAIANYANLNYTLAPRYYDYQLAFDYPVLGGRLKLLVYGSDDALTLLLHDAPDQDPGLKGQFENRAWFHALNLYYDRAWGPFELWASTSVGPQHNNIGVGANIGADLDVIEWDVRLEGRYALSKQLRFVGGLDLQSDWFTVTGSAPYVTTEERLEPPLGVLAKRPFAEHGFEWNPALYLEAQWRPTERWLIVPGWRVDSFSGQGFAFDPRINVRFEVAPKTFLKAGVGLFHEPTPAPYADAQLGNPKLRPEQALQLSLGVQTTPFKREPSLHGELTLFYKDLRHLPVSSDALLGVGGAARPELYSDEGIGRVYGLDLLLRRELAPWFYGWIAYTLLRSERLDHPGQPGASWRPFSFDQTHLLTVVGTVRLPRHFSIGLRFRYATGDPQIPIRSASYLSDYDVYYPAQGAAYSERVPAFHQLDLRVDKKFVFALWSLSIYLDVQNVYYRRNVEGYAYSYDYSRRVEVTGLPILPSLGVKGEF
jgi:outer membrane receptor protein involved in Fe transport